MTWGSVKTALVNFYDNNTKKTIAIVALVIGFVVGKIL